MILKACFELGFGVAKWFNLIVAITGLHKTQVSNWVRQRRYHLRKLGQFPPVPQTVTDRYNSHRSNKENDLFFPEPSIAQSRKRRRPRALSGQPKAKRFLPLTTKKERIQPGTFQHQYLVKSQPHFNEVVQVFLESCHEEAWGLRFGFDEQISEFIVTRVDLGLQAHEKGIKIGWKLKSVNEMDATRENRELIELFVSEQLACFVLFEK
jgi:hypothetical protein